MSPFQPAPIKPQVSLDDLDKLDIRAGTILSVEEVPGSDRLVKLTVDLGDHRRTVLSAMKGERTDPKEIEGRQALFLVNLKPRKMMGLVSEGMILDVGYADGLKPVLALTERIVPNGARIG